MEKQFSNFNGKIHNTLNYSYNNELAIYIELEIDNSCDLDDGGGDEPLIQELNLDHVISQVPPKLMEQEHRTPPESASPTVPVPNSTGGNAETIFDIGNNFSE